MGCSHGAATVLQKERRRSESRNQRPIDFDAGKGGLKPVEHHPAMDRGNYTVLSKYRILPHSVVGEGTFSVCRRAVCIDSHTEVAVKVYRNPSSVCKEHSRQKFQRQVAVLRQLQKPFKVPQDPRLWCEELESTKPSRLFLQILDYSRGEDHQPGPDPKDHALYIVSELAQCSLKEFLSVRKVEGKGLGRETIKSATKAILTIMAGLHAKGLVHMDPKPENLMLFPGGRLKLIDLDSCVKSGQPVSPEDYALTFSPCYCAPEWAEFLVGDKDATMPVTPSLDAWSTGMTLCELVCPGAVLKPIYDRYMFAGSEKGDSNRATARYLEWLSQAPHVKLPAAVEGFDPHFTDLVANWLLTMRPEMRSSCAECLSYHPYFTASDGAALARAISSVTFSPSGDSSDSLSSLRAASPRVGAGTPQAFGEDSLTVLKSISSRIGSGTPATPAEDSSRVQTAASMSLAKVKSSQDVSQAWSLRHPRRLQEDNCNMTAMHAGALFKLEERGDANDIKHWQRRDMWINALGALCFFSLREGRRLILADGLELVGAEIKFCDATARKFAFSLRTRLGDEHFFAGESSEELQSWTDKLKRLTVDPLATKPAELRRSLTFKASIDQMLLQVRNRRRVVREREREQFAPVFQGTLWKVKSGGDRSKPDHWFQREMWVAKNGSLVYWSHREECELVYYTAQDVIKARIQELDNSDTAIPWAFSIALPASGNLQYSPGEFAAESQEQREMWVTELMRFAVGHLMN